MKSLTLLTLTLATIVAVSAVSLRTQVPVRTVQNLQQKKINRVLPNDASTVKIANGTLQGNVYADSRSFLGIPFAQPPVGDLRWATPQTASNWTGVRDATKFSDGCPQSCNLPIGCPAVQSEDCLYLNVYTPITPGSTPAPVMVFLPGGRYMQGTAGTELYNARKWVNNTGVIIVTTNYRLGALGFMNTDSLQGNWGFHDQRLAMMWVRDNIAAFGGNPASVTLFGQSAGGTSTASHLVSPLSQGLFHRAIVQSNPWSLKLKTPKQAAEIGAKMAKDLGCKRDDSSCMRSKSWQDVVTAQKKAQGGLNLFNPLLSFYPWTPIVDGKDLTDQPMSIYASGNGPKTPVIFGTVGQEGVMFIYQALAKTLTNTEYSVLMDGVFYFDAGKVKELYPFSTQPSPTPVVPNPNGTEAESKNVRPLVDDNRTSLSVLANDYILMCPARHSLNGAATSGAPSWYYQFDHVMSFSDLAWGNDTYCDGQVCHGSELPFVFNSPSFISDGTKTANFTAEEQKLSNIMGGFWANFATTGNPNQGPVSGLPNWPQFDTTSSQNFEFTTTPFVVSNLKKNFCDFWDTTRYKY